MCSLGRHQEGDDIRPPRRGRHSDGSASAALAATPRETLAARRKKMRAELKEIKAETLKRRQQQANGEIPVEDRPEPEYDHDQFLMNFEPMAPGTDLLPDCMVDHEAAQAKVPYWVDIS